MAMTFLCNLADLDDPGSRGLTVNCGDTPVDIFLVRQGTAVQAYINSCPHTGAPLDWVPDRFLSLDGEHIQCSTHHALFRWQDGNCIAGPCAGDTLTPVPLVIRDGAVFLEQQQFCAGLAGRS